MGIKFLKTVLLITLVQVFLFGSCNKNGTTPCANSNAYSFTATSEWTPQKDNYVVGDTLFLKSSFQKKLTDQNNSSIVVNYSDAVSIGGDIGIAYLDTLQKMRKPAKDSFQFFSYVGQFVERTFSQNQGINFKYSEGVTEYSFYSALILRKKGWYAISVDNLISQGLKGKNCTNATFKMTVTNGRKNEVFYESHFGITLDQDSKAKIYCFEVR